MQRRGARAPPLHPPGPQLGAQLSGLPRRVLSVSQAHHLRRLQPSWLRDPLWPTFSLKMDSTICPPRESCRGAACPSCDPCGPPHLLGGQVLEHGLKACHGLVDERLSTP